MKTKLVKVSELVEDFDLYPRVSVDAGHTSQIAEAISAGTKLPLIIVEEKTLRIVDGFHRSRAYKSVHGKDHELTVDVRKYKDGSEIFLEAMRLNASHGRNMTSYDKAHAIARAEKLEIDPAFVATALNMTITRIAEMKTDRCCKMAHSRVMVPLKVPVLHMSGKTLTREQADAIPRLGGNQQTFYANQLITLIETDMLDVANEKLMKRLEILSGLLDDVLKSQS